MILLQNFSDFLKQSVIPLWLGAGKSAGNIALGAPGAVLKAAGDWADDFNEPSDEQRLLRGQLQRNLNMHLNLPDSFGVYEAMYPKNNNPLAKAGEALLNANSKVQNNVNNARSDFLGDNSSLLSRSSEGLGTMLLPFLFYWAGGSPLAGAAAKGVSETLDETGNFANNMHSNGQFDRNNQKNALDVFFYNSILNSALSPYDGLPGEIAEQFLLQNPLQNLIRKYAEGSLSQQ